jgi:hypothetical protein
MLHSQSVLEYNTCSKRVELGDLQIEAIYGDVHPLIPTETVSYLRRTWVMVIGLK